MKKKTKFLILIFIIPAVLLFNYLTGFWFFNAGKIDLNHKDYAKAVSDLKIAVARDSNNSEYHYYLAEALFFTSDFENSQKEYEKIIKLDPVSNLAKQAFEGIRKTQGKISQEQRNFVNSVNSAFSGLGDNYINNVTYDGKIVHWSLDKLPLKLYFKDSSGVSGFQPYYISAVTKAFDRWIKYLNGKLSYVLVNNPAQADITISFVQKIGEVNTNGVQRDSTQGLTQHIFDGNMFKTIDIKFATFNPNSQELSKQEMYSMALHEAGHALGLIGHSYDRNDVMYPISQDNNITDFRDLSLRDISTIRYLYNLDADISNVPPSKRQKKYDKNGMILGNVDSRLNKELKEAINYVNTVSSNQYGWTKLGDAYHNIKNYDKAIASYKKALESDPNYTPAKERIALTYAETGSNDAAINEYTALVAGDPGNIDLSTNLAILYMRKKQKPNAKKVIDALIERNPQAKNDETIQKIMASIDNNGIQFNLFKLYQKLNKKD